MVASEQFVRDFLKNFKGVNPKTVVPFSMSTLRNDADDYFYAHGATLSSQNSVDGSWPYSFDGKVAYFGNLFYSAGMFESGVDYIKLADGQRIIWQQNNNVYTGYTGLKIIPFEVNDIYFDNLAYYSDDGATSFYFVGWRITF